MQQIVNIFFIALGSAIMAVSTVYAVMFVVGETIEHFAR